MTRRVSFVTETFHGTRWPVPKSWAKSSEGVFSGSEGILNVVSFDGGLIDPSRCDSAAIQRPGTWLLARTVNGVAAHGRVLRKGMTIVVGFARSDCPPGSDWQLPEVQASYVFRGEDSPIAAQIAEELAVRPIEEREYGTIDQYGHAAMGPVPLHVSWSPVGEDAAVRLSDLTQGKATLSLLGGGMVTLADADRCCGVLLVPMPWRSYSSETAMLHIRESLSGSDVRFLSETATVWNFPIFPTGCSYEAFDRSDRSRVVGAVWEDQFGQAWHLRYWFSSGHGRLVEQQILGAKDVFYEV